MDNGQSAAQRSFLDIGDLLKVLWRHALLIAAMGILGAAGGVAYVVMTPKEYTAVSSVFFETQSQKVINIEAVLPGLSADRSMIESQIQILGSRLVFERAVANLIAKEEEARNRKNTDKDGVDDRTSFYIGSKEIVADLKSPEAQLELWNRLKIKRNNLSYIMDVEYKHPSAEFAAMMANAVANAYIEMRSEETSRATRSATEKLRSRVQVVGEEVKKSHERLQKYKTENQLFKIGILEITERQISDQLDRLATATAKEIQAEALSLQAEQLEKNPRLLNSLSSALNSEVIQEYRRQQALIERNYTEFKTQFGEGHVSTINARAQLDNIERGIEVEIKRLVSNYQNEREMSGIQVNLFKSVLERLIKDYTNRNEARIELAEYEQQVAASQQLYVALLKRLRETEVGLGLQPPDARVLSYASPPENPSWPRSKLTVALALIGGVGLGGFGALLRFAFGTVVRTEEDVQRLIGFEPIATLPRVSLIDGSPKAYPEFARGLYAVTRWLEQFKAMPSGGKVVVIASSRRGDGKSMIASSLAHYHAQHGNKTLLIDCDLSNPDLAREFSSSDSLSLIDAWDRGVNPEEAIVSIGPSALHFCPAQLDADPDESERIIATQKMESFLSSVRGQFDLVILDTAALGISAEMHGLFDYCDCALFVLRSGSSTKADFEITLAPAMSSGSVPVGFVFNMARSKEAAVNRSIRRSIKKKKGAKSGS